MKSVEAACTEEQLVKGSYKELTPDFTEGDSDFFVKTSAEMYHVLLNITTGEANAVVRRSLGSGWLAWKRLTSSLNPRTLASGIKTISAALNPQRITMASKADAVVDEWKDELVKLQTEYGEVLSSKMKVAVLYSMMPKDFQEKILDACAVAWDGTSEAGAGELYEKVKIQIKNLAKARREMQGPKPMEVDRIANSWADWSEDWDGCWRDVEEVTSKDDDHDHNHEEANIQYIGKGGGKKGGKGFQGYCYVCGGFGHTQWDCHKSKGQGKSFGKDGGYGKGYSKDGYAGKGYSKGKGGKGGMRKACFGCGSAEHVITDCPKNTNVQRVEEDIPEILFIGNVQNKEGSLEGWKKMPMKVTLGDFVKDSLRVPIEKTQIGRTGVTKNRFKVLEVDEEDEEEVVNVRQVENSERTSSAACGFEDGKAKNRVQFVNSVIKEEDWASLGVGDIIVDSAADESCWPVGQGDAFPTKESRRKMLLRTANGGDMQHYGQKEVTFNYDGGESKDPIGLKFQVTDVRKPLLAVRRLVEKGNKVVLAGDDEESYIMNKATKVKIPVKKKGGAFVIEARFVKRVFAGWSYGLFLGGPGAGS